jgi:hypothetical protein
MNHRHVSQIEADLDEATNHARQLKDDLQKKQTYIMKLEADAIGNAVCIVAVALQVVFDRNVESHEYEHHKTHSDKSMMVL